LTSGTKGSPVPDDRSWIGCIPDVSNVCVGYLNERFLKVYDIGQANAKCI